MGDILQFIPKPPSRFGFERVKKSKAGEKKNRQQLNLFSPAEQRDGQVLPFPRTTSPFEEALAQDEQEDKRARDSYLWAIEQGDCVPDAYCNLGILEFQLGNASKAFDCFTNSLRLDPRHREAHFNLGNMYFELGDLNLAQVHYEIAAEIDPSFPNLYFNLGLVLALREDYAGAITKLRRYKELSSPDEGRNIDELLANLQRSASLQR